MSSGRHQEEITEPSASHSTIMDVSLSSDTSTFSEEMIMSELALSPGESVHTKFGTGVVIKCSDEMVKVRVWRQPGKSIVSGAVATLSRDSILKKVAAAPGMTVRLSPSDKAQDSTSDEMYLIERYLPAKDAYLASSTQQGGRLARTLAVMSSSEAGTVDDIARAESHRELRPEQIDPKSTSSRFYPALEELIQRGEEAWSRAIDTASEYAPQILDNANQLKEAVTVNNVDISEETVAKLISDTSSASISSINNKLDMLSLGKTPGDESPSSSSADLTAQQALTTAAGHAAKVTNAASSGLSLPQAEEVKQIYTMLRDDDLTLLLKRGKERLKELIDVEVPERTSRALSAMGIELEETEYAATLESGKISVKGGLAKLQRDAMDALNKLLEVDVSEKGIVVQGKSVDDGPSIKIDTAALHIDPSLLSSTDAAKTAAVQQFHKMFDTLTQLAKSDSQMQSIYTKITDRTQRWQEMTGKILETETASLFMEGSQRLRSRAMELLNVAPGQIGSVFGTPSGGGVDLMRAFTEGDIAMAKLKGMQMTSAVRTRLFAAIELRSESLGGLDSVIAGSIKSIEDKGGSLGSKTASFLEREDLKTLSLSSTMNTVRTMMNGQEGLTQETMQDIMSRLQTTATVGMKDTKESLIALLSRRSAVRDSVLLRLEQVFLELESQLGEDLTAQQLHDLVGGKGGTLALFQPVAAMAAKEIEAQLDAAEAKMKETEHWDPRAESALSKVRQIARGELSMDDLLDLATEYLNDEEVVAKSGDLIMHAESLLDNFEAASSRIEKAGDRGDGNDATVQLMDAVTKAGITKDTVLSSVEGLDVNKLIDDTQSVMTDEAARRELVSSAGDTALDFLLEVLPSLPVPPFDGVREGLVYHLSNLSMAGFKVKKEDIYIEVAGLAARKGAKKVMEQPNRQVKATELLIIDVRNISAVLDDALWSFEQTYMPYLKGKGRANTRLWDGAIRLKFELRRHIARTKKVNGEELPVWEPILCLNDRSCSIGGIELTIQGSGRITWAANKLAKLLQNPLRDYVVSVIVAALKNNSGWLVDTLNQNLRPYWDLVMRTANLELDKLPKLSRHHVTKADDDLVEDEVELVWRERVPLGINILTNCDSGYLKVIDLPRGTQARKVAHDKQLDPEIFKGSTIVSVNGRRFGPDSQVELFAALKDPARPKAILFKLDSEGGAKMSRIMKQSEDKGGKKSPSTAENENLVETVSITQDEIGLKFTTFDDGFSLAVASFISGTDGRPPEVEQTGKVRVHDLLSHVNGITVLGGKGKGKQSALSCLEKVGAVRPLNLGFVKPYRYKISIDKSDLAHESFGGPSELKLKEVKSSFSKANVIVLDDFAQAEGAAETGGVFVGDNLVFINGVPVGAGCRLLQGCGPSPKLEDVIAMLKQLSPLALTFARARAKQSKVKTYLTSSPLSLDVEAATTFSLAALEYNQLGCVFATGYNGSDIVVKSITGVNGLFQKQMGAAEHDFVGSKLESIDGEFLPSYVNVQLIENALKRRWAASSKIELTFCNETRKEELFKLASHETAK